MYVTGEEVELRVINLSKSCNNKVRKTAFRICSVLGVMYSFPYVVLLHLMFCVVVGQGGSTWYSSSCFLYYAKFQTFCD